MAACRARRMPGFECVVSTTFYAFLDAISRQKSPVKEGLSIATKRN
jgi:hypothetical protein